MIQAGVLPLGLFHHENTILPNLIPMLDTFSGFGSHLKDTFSGFGSYFPLFQKLTGLGGSFRSRLQHYLANRRSAIVPSVTSSAVANANADPANGILSSKDIPSVDHLIKPDFFRRHLLDNYEIGGPTGAASSPFRVASSTTV